MTIRNSLEQFDNPRDYTTPNSIIVNGININTFNSCGITLPFSSFFFPDQNNIIDYFSFRSTVSLRDYTTFYYLYQPISINSIISDCGITLPFSPLNSIDWVLNIKKSIKGSISILRDYTTFLYKIHSNPDKRNIKNCGITLPFCSFVTPEHNNLPSGISFRSPDILRDYTTSEDYSLEDAVSGLLISCGITLPFAGSYYPKLRDYTTPFLQFLDVLKVKYHIICGITLPFITYKALYINTLNKIRFVINKFETRDYTTFCGITLPCLGLHYPKFRRHTALYAVLHLLFIRYHTAPKKWLKSLVSAYFKGFIFFLTGFIKLPSKTLLNYYIKHIKDFTTVQLIKQCLHTQTHLFAPKRKRG